MDFIKDAYDNAWKSIISPNQYVHNIHAMVNKYSTSSKKIEIIEFITQNDEGKKISSLILKQKGSKPSNVIFYLHGNGGCKAQCLSFIPFVNNKLAILSFDFIGCGNSDHGYLTYGVNESSDAEVVLRSAYKHLSFEKLTIWGRSMGALTAIKFAQKNGKIISNLVLDSPFRMLKQIILRVIKEKTQLPSPLDQMLFFFLKSKIQDKLSHDIFNFDHSQGFKKINKSIPILLLYSQNDKIVPKQEVFQFFNLWKGHKELIQIVEEHDEDRSDLVISQGIKWIQKPKLKKNSKLKLIHNLLNIQWQKQNVSMACGCY